MAEIQEKREKWKKEQARLRGLLRTQEPHDFIKDLKYVGGVDISFVKNSDKALACLSVLEYPSLKLVETFYHNCIMTEPYMPGFLGFREVEHLIEVVNMFLRKYPSAKNQLLIMVDGNGILHYRQFGSASHLGVLLGVPTIGVGKELLVVDGMNAEYIAEQCRSKLRRFGDQVDLVGPRTGRLYGRAVRTKSAYEPIYVSIGHMISLETAIDLVLRCSKEGTLLPEPVRLADGLSRDVIAKMPREKKPSHTSAHLPSSLPAPPPRSSPQPSTSAPPKKGSPERATPSTSKKGNHERDARAILAETLPEKETSSEKGKGKRAAHWDCDCGAHNSMQRDVCEFCYHSRKAASPPEQSISGAEVAISGDTQRRKKSWVCVCGFEVVDSVSCKQCRHINM